MVTASSLENVSENILNFIGTEQFKFQCTQDEDLQVVKDGQPR